MDFPNIDPIAIAIGPLQIHWYALAYLTGFLGGWAYGVFLLKRYGAASPFKPHQFEDLLTWIVAGVILGGRLGYALIYNPVLYLHNPADILKLWQGGMSFHGGFAGVLVAVALWARKNKLAFLTVTDVAAAVTPIGLFFGRIANFVNGELYGRVTTAPWGIIFPNGGPLPRHPSQLYEAILEGLVLFAVLLVLARRRDAWSQEGLLSGTFLIGYALSRMTVEMVREPDTQIGYLFGNLTMGQLLSLPLLIGGVWIIVRWTRLKAS
ncbi:MAG: prolipoprotein diacylglyceryl transferase [Alphaproteobacteria bacterium]|nr:prolipoprotein diacylglyceryl transferase [Alphaproteobacteria bacterium]